MSANASVRATPARKVLVVEDDVFLRLLEVVLDPAASGERRAAFADFFAHDEPDFEGWCARVRKHAGGLASAEVRLVETQAELRAQLGHADAVVVESLALGAEELAAAPRLKAVQKYGTGLRNIDTAAVAARGQRVHGLCQQQRRELDQIRNAEPGPPHDDLFRHGRHLA